MDNIKPLWVSAKGKDINRYEPTLWGNWSRAPRVSCRRRSLAESSCYGTS